MSENPDCKSIQTILTHVVSAGYSYAAYIAEHRHIDGFKRQKTERASVLEYTTDLDAMFAATCRVFQNLDDKDIEQGVEFLKIKTRWGQTYDIEQLMEHAIVHILRHRRQIERFLERT